MPLINELPSRSLIALFFPPSPDKLRSLWPSLGFVFTILSVAVIIMVNYLIEKHRGEKKLPLEDDDFDGINRIVTIGEGAGILLCSLALFPLMHVVDRIPCYVLAACQALVEE